ncbi:DUF2156 domain-containing protein [bacterium]|nr:DUF2156 domain-containing protein [bacterium]
MTPQFPNFEPIKLKDREIVRDIVWRYQSQTSEWTFTNLYIWRDYYGFQWSLYKDWLVVLSTISSQGIHCLQPIGPPSRIKIVRMILQWLIEEKGAVFPRIERADERLISEIKNTKGFRIEATENHYDYVYRSDDLIHLSGRKYHNKKNHINKFLRSYEFEYMPLDGKSVDDCIRVAEEWCKMRRCEEDMSLVGEGEAVRNALNHFDALKISGGAILIDDKIEAFTLGELLNTDTAVIHIEKTDPTIPALYTMINQQFCENQWSDIQYINREQDLGVPGLRRAKRSYYPCRLVKKYRIF